ncbi:MAG: hypothetical protein ACI9F9_001862 [Candidatus Paceibacteria bacterium]|jgi:hypothetical protein
MRAAGRWPTRGLWPRLAMRTQALRVLRFRECDLRFDFFLCAEGEFHLDEQRFDTCSQHADPRAIESCCHFKTGFLAEEGREVALNRRRTTE